MPLKFKYCLLGLLVLGTATLTTTYWHFGMAGITAFLLAYFSKGMRSHRSGIRTAESHKRLKTKSYGTFPLDAIDQGLENRTL